MRDLIRKALTTTILVKDRERVKQIQVVPGDRLVYGMYFAIAALISLTFLEAMYMYVFRNFSNEIFAAITLVIGTILGAFFGQKG
ncbi:MAG: hypothetical protein JSV12_06200 [Candidatus Bathyarchaeota archaeon]|nr:MAG: hypothetical protein JSV12_06200 [Candidatus Bathyarchaeota archaeon]